MVTGAVREISKVSVEEVAEALLRGSIVLLPTETVYGLAVLPQFSDSVARVYSLKSRPVERRLPVLISSTAQLEPLGIEVTGEVLLLAEAFWPGPLTIVVGFREPTDSQPSWLAGREEVAIRLSSSELLRSLASITGPVLLTSANRHGSGPQGEMGSALAGLTGPVDLAVDAGKLTFLPSTIVNVRHSPPTVERLGAIGLIEINDVLREVDVDSIMNQSGSKMASDRPLGIRVCK